ncbi:MAG: pyridoxal phosphate-dependent aminotransferase [Thermoanaerobaculia bacterium]|nr:pyridoxal phosphate-dependent aminotransferase [Thermoanaerobaculia bacterium]
MTTATTKPAISRRALNVPHSAIRLLEGDANTAKARGVRIYHLNIGQPDIETPECIRRRASADRIVAYTPARGTEAVRSVMRDYYRGLGVALEHGQLMMTTGGSEALLFAMLACGDDGDEALIVEPMYANVRNFAAIGGITLRPLRTHVEDGFKLPPPEAWERAITDRTRFAMLCNPNNPTGTVSTPEEIRGIAEVCRRRGLFLIVDEVYREFVYDGRKPWSSLSLEGFDDTIVVADSVSKRYSACGMRLGCIATRNADVIAATGRMAEGRLSSPTIEQRMLEGIAELPADYMRGIVAEYGKRRDILFEGLTSIPGVELQLPQGAFYFIARLPVGDSLAFSRWLVSTFEVDGATVMLAPAPGFYLTPGLGRDEARIAYVLVENDLRNAIEILRKGIEAWNSR